MSYVKFEKGKVVNDSGDTIIDEGGVVMVSNQNTAEDATQSVKIWIGTQEEYDEFETGETESDTLYFVTE